MTTRFRRASSAFSARLATLEAIARDVRDQTVEVLGQIGFEHRGHPGAALSIVDLVTALYFDVMRIDPGRPDWPDRDRLVLSKGHGCLALYVALARRGFFDRQHLRTFRSVDSLLQGHPDMRRTPGVDMTSGSLGHGLSAAVGLALDAQRRHRRSRVHVILGDGELQEGLIWEGAMAAAKYRLRNLTAFVDCNGLQSSGRVNAIMPIEPLAAKWRAFGWRVLRTDGHDMRQILAAARAARRSRRPTVILARTIKGKGVADMEGDNRWHQACPRRQPPTGTFVAIQPDSAPAFASCRAAFGQAVLELARAGRDVMVVTSDTRQSLGLDEFARAFPERHVEVGIAEQNLVTVAAGLAAGGRRVFAATYATFASMRTLEQIRTFVAYPRLPVTVVAALGGLSGGIEGVAHLGVEDFGVLRCVPGLTLLNPADASATRAMVRRTAGPSEGPIYVRLGRDDTPRLFDDAYEFHVGHGTVLFEAGWDAVLMTTGLVTGEVLQAAATLNRRGLRCTVLEFATLKPLDRDLVLWGSRARHIVTIEEHSVVGGLGTAVMEILAERAPALVHRLGLPDRFLESGSPRELREKFGLTAAALAARVQRIADGRVRRDEPRRDDRIRDADHDRRTGQDRRGDKRHDREQHEDGWRRAGEATEFRVPNGRVHQR